MDINLQLLELYYNSGRGYVTFDSANKMNILEEDRAFPASDQLVIIQILLFTTFEKIQFATGVILEDLFPEIEHLSNTEVNPSSTVMSSLMAKASRRLGFTICCNNKLSELEVVLSPAAITELQGLNRQEYLIAIKNKLNDASSRILTDEYKVFVGEEYCKVTLFDKGEIVKKILKGFSNERILAFGDSSVDIPFLALNPDAMIFEAYYVGNPTDIIDYPSIQTSSKKNSGGTYQILQEKFEKHVKGSERISAIVTDIDNCIADLDKPLEKPMADLFKEMLAQKIRLFLITGGQFDDSYSRRIIEPLLS